jgi:hypothetical protein
MLAGMSDPAKALKENYYYFTRADQTATDVYTTFVLPLGVTCTRCVLQFRWTTGNSCYGGQRGSDRACQAFPFLSSGLKAAMAATRSSGRDACCFASRANGAEWLCASEMQRRAPTTPSR